MDVGPGDRSPRRRRGPGRGRDERAPERLRRAAPRPGTAPHRRAVALGAVGLPGRQRTRLARPVPRPRVRRGRPRWLRLQGAGRGLLRRLRGEDRGADPLRGRGDVGAQERRPARLPRGDLGRNHQRALRRGRDRPVPATGDPGDRSRRRRAPEHSLQLLPQPAAASRRRRPGGRSRVIGGADRRRAPEGGPRRSTSRSARTTGRRARYRGRDFVWWLGVLGKWEAATPPLGAEHVTIAVSGANGGHTVDFRTLAASGITLAGRTVSLRQRNHALRARPRRQHRRTATPTTCRCSTRPTPTSSATASISPRSRTLTSSVPTRSA